MPSTDGNDDAGVVAAVGGGGGGGEEEKGEAVAVSGIELSVVDPDAGTARANDLIGLDGASRAAKYEDACREREGRMVGRRVRPARGEIAGDADGRGMHQR